jgi:hypothetical protein
VYDESNTAFIIRGGFTLIGPNGGEKWAVGSSQTISWTTFGTIPNVKLEYSINSGSTYPNIIVASVANSGSYSWTIPNNVASTCRVRVSNAADSGSFDVSNADFKIMGGFTITAPDGGEVLVVGSSQNITWTTSGTVANVKLEYSTNGGTTYPNVITLTTPNTNSYTWVVPDAISTTARVKVSDASDADAYDTSNANFKIRAGFTLTAPNGGETWTVASSQNISWTTFGTVANVKLEYSTDSGSTYPNVIIASLANAGTYAWAVPDAITTAARVRISDVNDSTASDTSNSNFKIQGSLTITAPNGTEKWVVGSVQTITWNRVGSISFVKLEYATDGGTIYTPIVASTANTGTYSWTMPNTISTTCKVRVSDTNDATVNDVSNANFKIQAGFTITSPNGGETWTVGSSQNITWTTQGTVGFVKLDYSVDGGTTYPYVIVLSTSNLGTYAWTVPDSVSGAVRVRVIDTNDSEAFDTSNADFRIRATFSLTSPNGGQQWLVGNSYNITWTNVGTIANVKLEYSRDLFLSDKQTISASTANTGTYAWTVPDAISNTVRVRVSDPNDSGAYDDSNADFKITARFTVTSPNGTEKWDVGSSQNITWTWSGSVPNVKIEYSTNGGATYPNIISAPVNTGTYAWAIPDTISAEVKVKISDLADSTAYDISDANAKIRGKFTVTSPNGGEVWTVADAHNITWTTVGTIANVKLDYSTDSGASYPNAITASVANAGSYSWTLPDAISSTVRVRVMSTTDSDAYDASDGDFKIRGAFTMTAPNGAELWKIAQINNITWTRTGSIANAKLEYSTNSGATYPNVIIASTPAANLSYAWTIPDVPTPSARVKITDVSDSTVYDTSDANFRIQGFFTLTAPNGGEAWLAGTSQNITWTWGGTIPLVKLTYSTDSGATYTNTINAAAANGAGGGGSYSYSWAIPSNFALSPTLRVKVEDPNDNTVYDTSDANFKVIGAFTLTAPNGGERWVTNESRSITWALQGNITNAKLEYSTDGGLTYPNVIVASTSASALSYAWTVPDNRSATAKVRISDASDSTVYDVSNANFTIDYYNITWTVRDLLTNEQLTNLTVIEKITSTETIGWQQSALTSPITHATPYGFWTTTWSCSGFGDKAQNYTANADQSFTLYLETTAVHIWRAEGDFSYDSASDVLKATSWLERDGSVVSGATAVDISVYDDTSALINTLSSAVPSAAGYFNLTWNAPTGLQNGKVYSVLVDITNASGAHFKTPASFSISYGYNAESEFSYYAAGDDLKATVWLEIDGKMVTGVSSAAIKIYDESNNLIKTLNSASPSPTGYFNLLWDGTAGIPTGLVEGAVYPVSVEITNNAGVVFMSPNSFSITVAKRLDTTQAAAESAQAAVYEMRDVTLPAFQTSVGTTIDTKMGEQELLIEQKMAEQTQVIVGPTKTAAEVIAEGGMVGMVEQSLSSFENISAEAINELSAGAAQAVEAGQTLAATAMRYSWAASLAPNPGLINDAVTLSVQGPDAYEDPVTGALNTPMPLLSIYNWDNSVIIESVPLTKVKSGLYNYTFTADSRFTPGKAYTYIVSEYWTGGLISGSGVIESTSLTTMQGLVSQTPMIKTAIDEAVDGVKALQAVLGSGSSDGSNIFHLLSSLQESVEELPAELAKGGEGDLTKKVNEIAERLGAIAGEEGFNLEDMLEDALGESPTIKDIRSKTDAIQSVIKVLQMLFEAKFGGLDTPVVSTSLAPGSVKFRIVALNPSSIKTQRVPVKIYLPQEVKPKDIMDTGGLELNYDAEKSMYYVYRDGVELGPKESRFFEVEVEDIWIIPQKDLDNIRSQMFNLAGRFEKSSYADQVKATANNVYIALDEMAKVQADDSMSREQHIGIYRQNLELIKRFKEEIAKLEKLLQPEAGAPDIFEKAKLKLNLPSKATTWLIIFVIIIFLGLLAGVFFFVWQGQVRSSQDIIKAAKNSAFPEQKPGQGGEKKPAT